MFLYLIPTKVIAHACKPMLHVLRLVSLELGMKLERCRQTTLLSFIPELKKSKESAGEGKRQALLARQLDSS